MLLENNMEEEIRSQIKKRIEEYGYKSAKFRLALVKEEPFWKVLMGQIILDIAEPKENETFLKEENFALEDIYVSIREFQKFFEYLGHMHISDIDPSGNVTINKEIQFTIGNYDLCFVGNFPSRDLYFHGRYRALKYYGIEKPIYEADYYIHQSVSVRSHPKLDLTGGKIPFRDASEVINHFWKTDYNQGSLDHRCYIIMPIFEASISNFNLKEKKLELEFDVEPNLAKLDELSVGIIAEKKPKEYRKNHSLKEKRLDVDFDFNPKLISVYLNHKEKKIDEYEFYHNEQDNSPFLRRQTSNDFISEFEQEEILFQHELVSKLPEQIQLLLFEAEDAFKANLPRASAILFRSVIEEGITLILKQKGKEKELYDERNFEVGLGQKIRLIIQYVPSLSQVKRELDGVKWFGDKATHEAQMPISAQDISNNLEPKLRLILAKFVEQLK